MNGTTPSLPDIVVAVDFGTTYTGTLPLSVSCPLQPS